MLIAYFHHKNHKETTKFRIIVRKPDDVVIERLRLDALGGNAWVPACLENCQVTKILAHALLVLSPPPDESQRDGFDIREVQL